MQLPEWHGVPSVGAKSHHGVGEPLSFSGEVDTWQSRRSGEEDTTATY